MKKEFYIEDPETGLKKTDLNIITNNDEINDMNNNNMDYPNNDLPDEVYNHIDHDSVDLKQTNHNNLYTLADNELQLSYDLGDLDWSSTDSHKGELIIVYDNKVRYKTLQPRAFYVLYIKPNEKGSRHLIYRLSTDQIVVTKEYQTVPLPEDIGNTLFESHPCKNKSQVKNVDTIISSIHNDQYNNYNNNNQTSINDKDQYLQGTNEFLQSSLLTSLQSEFLPSSLLVSLQYGFLLLSLLASLRCGFLQSSLLVSLQSIFIQTSPLTPMWKTFLRRLYEYIPTVTPIPLKPEMFLQYIQRIVIIPEQVKPESPESLIPSRSSLQPYVQWFNKFVTYYMFDHNFFVDT